LVKERTFELTIKLLGVGDFRHARIDPDYLACY
jgi:hypothetical protein